MGNQSLFDTSSDLSSIASQSPPPNYPSPVSSQQSSAALSAPQPFSDQHAQEDEELPPKKRRKVVETKPRTTKFIDLQSPSPAQAADQEADLALLLKVLRKRRKIVVIAGAGISVSAGSTDGLMLLKAVQLIFDSVPDFRSSTGLFTTLRSDHKLKASGKHLFDASVYQTDSSTSSFHDMVRSLSKLVGEARPTAFHQMLATLAAEGRLMRLYTQNVDGIDTSLPPLETNIPLSMKGPWPRTIQLHGGLEKMVCSKCNHLAEFEAALFEGPLPPPCTACMETDKVRTNHAGKRSHGIGRLRPRIVLYNEHNPDAEAIGTVVSADLRTRPDALIVVGTSMKIPGVRRIAREMCGVVRGRKGGLTMWINQDAPPTGKEFENCWDLVVKGACDEVASRVNMRRWDDDTVEFTTCTESEAERAKARAGHVNIVIESPSKKIPGPTMPTPAPSPQPSKIKHMFKTHTSNCSHEKKGRPKKIADKCHGPKKHPKTLPGRNRKSKLPQLHLATITSSYNVTKPMQPLGKEALKATSKFVSSSKEKSEEIRPMEPISPQAARINGPVNDAIHGAERLLFPNLKGKPIIPLCISEDRAFTDVKRRRSDEIVSPTGAIPSGMSGLLH